LNCEYAQWGCMNENLYEDLQTPSNDCADWAGESLLIELDLPPEFSWGRLAETRMIQFEAALTEEETQIYPGDEEDERASNSFYVVDEVYIVSSEES
jgi:hypothetical protein